MWNIPRISRGHYESIETPENLSIPIQPGESFRTSEIIESFLAIQDGINNLFEISMMIRKRPERDEYIKASLQYQIDPKPDIIHVSDKYPVARSGEVWLMEHLGTAITRRRQYLRYRKEHQKKMEQLHEMKTDAERKTVWSGEKASTYLPIQNLSDYRTPLPTEQGPKEVSQIARTEYADSRIGKDGSSRMLRTPLLPRNDHQIRVKYGDYFECPYCWRVQKVHNKNEWKYDTLFYVIAPMLTLAAESMFSAT
jgi:hypothetical protein